MNNWLTYEQNIYFKFFITGKSLSEALILESVNLQYDKRLFIEFPEKYKFRTCCIQLLFFVFVFSHSKQYLCKICIFLGGIQWTISHHIVGQKLVKSLQRKIMQRIFDWETNLYSVLYLLKMCPIFVSPVHNFGNSDNNKI